MTMRFVNQTISEEDYQKQFGSRKADKQESMRFVNRQINSLDELHDLKSAKPLETPKVTSWDNIGAAQSDLRSWESELRTLQSGIDARRQKAEQLGAQLDSAYSRMESLRADSRLGADPVLTGDYSALRSSYDAMVEEYTKAAAEHDEMVGQYNDTLSRYQTGYRAYADLLGTQDKKAESLRSEADRLDEENKKLMEELKAGMAQMATGGIYGGMGDLSAALEEKKRKYTENEQRSAELRREADGAMATYYGGVPLRQDYADLSAAGAQNDERYAFINDQMGKGGQLRQRQMQEILSMRRSGTGKYGDYTPYTYMTDEETGTYNYLYAKEGKKAADSYLDSLANTLNRRMAGEQFENMGGAAKALSWIPAGLDQFATGIKQLGKKEALPTSVHQFRSQLVRQEAAEKSPLLAGAYDFGTMMTNMAPSILLSYATGMGLAGLGKLGGKIAGGVASAAMGASAGGHAYAQKVNEGYSPEQAKAYAKAVGAAEGALQYVLGGISALGGGSEKIAMKIAGIDNALGRVALGFGSKMAAEGMEEGLQEILAPAFETLILGEEFDVNFEDAAYSFLMGALSAGLLEGGEIIGSEIDRKKGRFVLVDTLDGYLGEDGIDYFEDCGTLEEVDRRYRALTKAMHSDVAGEETTAAMADINRQRTMKKGYLEGRAQGEKTVGLLPAHNSEVQMEAEEVPGLRLPTPEKAQTLQVDPELEGQANRLSAAIGRKVAFFTEGATEAGIRNGYFDRATNNIYANTESENPLAQIVAHELTHSVELADSYRSLSDMVFRHLEQEGRDLAQMRKEVQKLYADNGDVLDASGVDREIVAQYVEKHLLTDEGKIMELVQTEPSLGRKILNWLDGILAKLGSSRAQERIFLTKARDTYARALREARTGERRAEARSSKENLRKAYARGEISEAEFDEGWDALEQEEEELALADMPNSFSGPRAQTADLDRLKQAQEMAAMGVAAEQRRQQMPDRGDGNTVFARDADLQRSETDDRMEEKSSEIDKEGNPIYAKNRAEANIQAVDFTALTNLQKQSAVEFGLDEKEARTLTGYVRGMFGILNSKLNSGTITENDIGVVERTASALGKFPVFEGRTYRNLQFKTEEAYNAFLSEYAEGNLVSLKAFTSTSKRPNGYPLFGNGIVHMVIDGESGADIADTYGIPRQQEVILLPGTILRVEKVTTANDGRTLIYVREEHDYGLEDNYGNGRSARSLESNRNQSGGRESIGGSNYGQGGRVRRTAQDLSMGDGVLSGRGSGSEVPALRLGEAFEDTEKPKIQNSFSPNTASDSDADTDAASALRDSITGKAREYMERAERILMEKVGKALSIPSRTKEGRGFLQEISYALSEEYLREGRVAEEVRDRLFEAAYAQGTEIDTVFYEQYKDIKTHLRTTPLTISDADKSSIPDYGRWRKQAFGTLRIVNAGGLPVDTAYQELRGLAPELFPEDITHPADQLMHMYETARSIEKVEYSLDQAHGGQSEMYKQFSRMDFGTAIDDLTAELRQVRRYAEERQAEQAAREAARNAPMPDIVKITETYREMKAARKVVEKVSAKHLLTEHDQVQVGRLLRGELEPENLDPQKDNVKGIKAVYEAKAEYEKFAKEVYGWNARRKAQLRAEADELLETANDWKDKRMGALYARETMERNVRDIIEDEALAARIIETYFAPVHRAQAEATRMKNRYRDRVRQLNLSRDVAEGNIVSEAHAVQLLGEAEDNIRMLEKSGGRRKRRDGKTIADWQEVIFKLWAENPNLDEVKIREAADVFHGIYDELFTAMNAARVRNGYEPVSYRSGYFPHFQPGEEDGLLRVFGKALGIDVGVDALPTSINGLTHTFKPGIRWFGNAQERLGYNTAYDAVEGFDRYIEGVADVVHQTDNIQRLRALASQMRYRTTDQGIRDQVDAVKADKSLAEEDKENRIREIYEKGRFTLSNFVNELEEYTNLLANKKSRHDRSREQAMGRQMYTLVKRMESRVAANMVVIHPGSWLTNLIPITQGLGMVDTGSMLRGMWETLRSYKTDDGIAARSTFLTNRQGSDPLVQTWQQRTSAKLAKPMEWIDTFTAGSLVRARYYQNLERGMSETSALEEADAWTAGVMADRSKGATPTLFNRTNPLLKPFTQFQLEVNNQLSYIFKDMVPEQQKLGKTALAMALLRFAIGALLYNELYEALIGRRPALDPIGVLLDAGEDIAGGAKPHEVIGTVTGAAADQLPFMSGLTLMGIESDAGRLPMSSALPDLPKMARALTDSDWADGKRLQTLWREAEKPLAYLALPFGGGQLKKAIDGLTAVVKGGSYIKDERGLDILQYPVYNDTPGRLVLGAVGAVTFGKTSLRTGREWVERGFKNFSAAETATYQALGEIGIDSKEAYELLWQLKEAEKTETESEAIIRRRILREADLPKEAKAVIFTGVLTDSERDLAVIDLFNQEEWDVGEAAMTIMAIKDAEELKGAAQGNAKRTAIIESVLTEEEKETLWRYMLGDKKPDGSYAIGEKTLDKQLTFRQAGLDLDAFLQAQSMEAEYAEAHTDYGDRAAAMCRWIADQSYTAGEAEAALECFLPKGSKGEDKAAIRRAIIQSALDETEKQLALAAMGTDTEDMKLEVMRSFGLPAAAWVEAKERTAAARAEDDSIKQEEVTEIIRSMDDLSTEEKAALWQLQNTSWKGKNNPFSKEVGKQVEAMVEDLKKQAEAEDEMPEGLSLAKP